ncbi:MAG: DegT/DnrJ/EryC1/StrS family aminotransferase [Treponema sp.]|nr:DegT/DnrJ/EryC1/StrS family aminotransferase [Treponema sp.]
MSIPVFSSYIKRKDMDSVLSCLMTDSVGPGVYHERFQKAAREYFGFEYCLLSRSPIDGMTLALKALGSGTSEVAVLSALAPRWIGYALKEHGVEIAWADVSQETANPSASDCVAAMDALGRRATLLVLAGGGGSIAEDSEYQELGLPQIEDVTRSLGATRGGEQRIFSSTLSLLSLESGSLLTSGGGSMLFASGKREATVLRNLADGLLPELRMTDYNASLGLAQLRDLEKGLGKRRELRSLFLQSIAGKKYRTFAQGGDAEPGCFSFPVVLESSIKDAIAYARKKDVETELAFVESCVSAGLVPEGRCPNARSLAMRTLLFPLHQRIGNAGAQKIARVLATLP